MSAARDEAVAAFSAGRRDARELGGVDEDDVVAAGLDAIPTDVLVRLVIERGGLERCGQTLMFASADGGPREVVPVYRIAGESQKEAQP